MVNIVRYALMLLTVSYIGYGWKHADKEHGMTIWTLIKRENLLDHVGSLSQLGSVGYFHDQKNYDNK